MVTDRFTSRHVGPNYNIFFSPSGRYDVYDVVMTVTCCWWGVYRPVMTFDSPLHSYRARLIGWISVLKNDYLLMVVVSAALLLLAFVLHSCRWLYILRFVWCAGPGGSGAQMGWVWGSWWSDLVILIFFWRRSFAPHVTQHIILMFCLPLSPVAYVQLYNCRPFGMIAYIILSEYYLILYMYDDDTYMSHVT